MKILNTILVTVVLLLLNACTSSTATPVVKSPSFERGEKDGCTTASGAYTKDSDAFNADSDYKNGWFSGRKNCNPAQVK